MEAERPYVCDGKRLDYEELQRLAHAEVQDSEYTQQELADRFDVTRSTIGKAVTQAGPRYQRLQMRLVEALTDYEFEMERETWFRARRRETA